MTKSKRLMLSAAAAGLLSVSPASAATLLEMISANPNLSTFTTMVRKAGLEDQLRGPGPVTLFAPTNQAFESMPYVVYRRLTETATPAELRGVIQGHMVSWGSSIPTGTEGSAVMTTLGRTQLGFQGFSASTVRVNGRPIQQINMRADNGYLHIVSDVLPLPQ